MDAAQCEVVEGDVEKPMLPSGPFERLRGASFDVGEVSVWSPALRFRD